MSYGVFDAADGPLVFTVGNNVRLQRFCREVIGRPDLAEDENFKTNLERSRNRAHVSVACRPNTSPTRNAGRGWLGQQLATRALQQCGRTSGRRGLGSSRPAW